MSTELVTQSEPETHDTLRQQLMSLPADQLKQTLSEYEARRNAFRAWLLSSLTEGVHYGYPPGCKPVVNANGDTVVTNWKDKSKSVVPKEQWTVKPSLYEAGADLLIDLLFMRGEYAAATDVQAALDLKNQFIMRCTLFDRGGKKIGEGLGASVADDIGKRNGQGLNLALKLSKKRAKVDAVKNTLGISDLFTQDLEDLTDDDTKPPKKSESAPETQPRAERVEKDEIDKLAMTWKGKNPKGDRTNEQWRDAWFDCCRKNGGPRNPSVIGSWSREHVRAIENFLKLG